MLVLPRIAICDRSIEVVRLEVDEFVRGSFWKMLSRNRCQLDPPVGYPPSCGQK